MMPSLWKKRSSRRTEFKVSGVVFGVFLLLGVFMGLWIGNVAARQATRRTTARAAEVVAESAREVGGAIADRRRALELLALLPMQNGSVSVGALDRFRRLYPEFRSVTVQRGGPKRERNTIALSVPLSGGRYLIGLLRKGWATKILVQEERTRPSRIEPTMVLVGKRGPKTGAASTPPALGELLALTPAQRASVEWSDGNRYVTTLNRLRTLNGTQGRLALVGGVRTSTLAAQAMRIRRAGLILGFLIGAVPGALALVGIARSTRKLRAKNQTLEKRVHERTEELATAERSFRDIFENVPLGLYQCDAFGRLLRVNPALAQMYGYFDPEDAAESLGTLSDFGNPADRAEFVAKLKTAGRAETVSARKMPHGRTVWLRETAHAVYDSEGRLQGFEGVVTDVTEQRALEAQLRQIGATDPLTGLLNRRGFHEAIEAAQFPATVSVLDVDRFKEFNDTYGHPAGDRALRAVAAAMQAAIRERGVLARTGGEEFALFLPGIGLEAGLEIAEEVRKAIEACAIPENMLTISGGVARATSLTQTHEAFEDADRALYSAKEAGRNRIVARATSLL